MKYLCIKCGDTMNITLRENTVLDNSVFRLALDKRISLYYSSVDVKYPLNIRI